MNDDLRERFDSLFMELQSRGRDKGWFYLAYKRPNGSIVEQLGRDRDGLISEMNREEIKHSGLGSDLLYLCRRIGDSHPDDNYVIQKYTLAKRRSHHHHV